MMRFSELVNKISRSNKGLGELLRAVTFVGKGCGCYENFDLRPDATKWSKEQLNIFISEHLRTKYARNEQDQDKDRDEGKFIPDHIADDWRAGAEGYTFNEDGLTIDVIWYWDGDGTLAFRVKQDGKVKHILVHHDCKNDYGWENFTPIDPAELQKFFEQNKSWIMDNAI